MTGSMRMRVVKRRGCIRDSRTRWQPPMLWPTPMMGCVIWRRKWLIMRNRSRGWSFQEAATIVRQRLEYDACMQWILTVISEVTFVQDSTLALVCNVCDPYSADLDAFRLESLVKFVP